MALENIYRITVNTKSKMFREIPEIVANDKVVFEIEVFEGATLFTLLPEYSYKFVSKKPSGNPVIRDAALVDGVIRVELGSSEMTTPGRVEGTVQIFDSTMNRISTAKFDYNVVKDPSMDGALPTDDKTLVIANESVLLEAIDKSDLANARIDTQLTGAPQLDEAKDIRVRADGTIAPSAGAHVRELATNLAQSATYPKQLGAKIDGVSNDTGFINEAISTGKKLVGLGTTVVTSLANPYALSSEDSLKIIRQSDGYLFNSYADKYNRLVFGQEYLSYFHRRIALGSGVKLLFTGDSTTAGLGLLDDYRIHNLIKKLATNDGFYNVSTVNRGQSGKTSTEWITTYLSGDIAENADLVVVRWGINDPEKGGDLSTFLANVKNGLQQLRTNKDYTKQSIVLMMPSTTSDSDHGRGELWYESMVTGLKRLAREFKCVFIDTYAYLQDSRNAFDYMDSTYSGKSSMHPKEIMNLWIGDKIYDVLFPRALKLLHGQPEPTLIGVFDSVNNPNGMQNNWTTLSGYRQPAYWYENGMVKFMGVLYGGITTNGTTLFKLPYTLTSATFLNVGTRGGGGVLLVQTDGTVKVENLIAPASGTQWISLEGGSYKFNRNLVTLP